LDDLLQSEAPEDYETEDMDYNPNESRDEDCEDRNVEVEEKESAAKEELSEEDMEELDAILKSKPEPEEQIAVCLTDAAKATAKPVKRSSFEHEYDTMRKQLRALIIAAERYHAAMCEIEKTRKDVATRLSTMSEDTPLHSTIGGSDGNGDSLCTFYELVGEFSEHETADYRKNVIDSLLEWEKTLKSKVDADLTEIHRLYDRLDHNQRKIDILSKKVKTYEEEGKNTQKLDEDIYLYQDKVEQDLTTCNLLEEVVKNKWKDMYPIVKAFMEWESNSTARQYDIFAKLPVLENKLTFVYKEHDPSPGLMPSLDELDLAKKERQEEDECMDTSGSDTSGSVHSRDTHEKALIPPKPKWHVHPIETM